MYIKSLMVHNFKSIDTVQIDFNPMTMIIGANATGKSNIINVFRFIEDIMTDGVENAIALQGGIQYIANANLSRGEPIEIQFTIDLKDEGWIRHIQRQKYALEVEEIVCRFVIHPNKRGMGYNIAYDYIKMIYDCNSYDSSASKDERYAPLGIEYSTEFERKNRNSSVKIIPNISNSEQVDDELKRCLHEDSAGRYFSFVASEDKSELMLYRLSLLLPPYFSENTFIRIFDLDPKELKKPSSMVSTKILDENGANLASILQTILRKKERSKKLTSLLKGFLPFVDNVSVEHNPDKSVSYKIKECYYNKSFYANFLSDGTVSILALILALYFEDHSNIIILEEPERNIHPKLLANLISSAEDVSKEKQVIITTHNPELLKYASCDDVRMVTRANCGNTSVTKPSDDLTIKTFLENDLGLEDLFVQGLLE